MAKGQKTRSAAEAAAQKQRTKANKIKAIEKELAKNPNNTVAKQSLEKWKKQ